MTSGHDSARPVWMAALPPSLRSLPLGALELPMAVVAALAGAGMTTVADVLSAPPSALADDGTLGRGRAAAVADALQRALVAGLAPRTITASDWPTLRAQLLAPLAEDERRWLEELVGFDHEPAAGAKLARQLGVPTTSLDDRAERVRAAFAERAPELVERLHREAANDLRANEGVVQVEHAAVDSIVHRLARSAPDRDLGLRLIAFLFPQECCHARGALFAMSPRRHRRLLRMLPSLVPPHRLPLPVETLRDELRGLDLPTPRGALLHALRSHLRVAIVLDPVHGETAVADPRTPATRLAELLQEAGRPLAVADLAFAYRERFREGDKATVRRCLQQRGLFVRLGADHWGLRADNQKELAAVAPLVDRVARRLLAEGGRRHVADLLPADERDERTVHYVLDGLANDPRVRMLGRGDACAARHRRSQALESLLHGFRRAGGDVLLGRFLDNQPEPQRRLVERLLRHNRLFVQPAPDRVDLLANWPFNDERLQRLVALVQAQLQQRAGYAHSSALKAAIDRTDLGGDWLTAPLLEDVLRRNGPFEVVPGGIVARAELDLVANVRRSLRSALRAAGASLTVGEVLQQRPELAEFAPAIADLLRADPLVQSDDGARFSLA
jgi:hypothetical protein